ncbi:tail fiber domain-containing protein [Enterobacter asburiae]|uniref:tail fiber domain-containing protein n=1 Tax=Enterobacter asburiae TaxID=61645 RepID=UPI003CF08BDF
MATSQYLSPPFARPSECMEVSGEPIRGVQVHAGTIQGWDDVLVHMHDCGNMNFYATYFESQIPYQTVNGGNAPFGYGARMIASRQSTSSLVYAAGNTRSLRMEGCTEGNGIDWGPEYTTYSDGRYVTTGGVFKPRDSFIAHKILPEQADSEVRLSSEKGIIKIQPFTGKYVYIGPASGDSNIQSNASSLNLLSGLRVRTGNSSGGYWTLTDSAKFTPAVDNTLACGQPSTRWSTVYAATGTISTSDGRYKSEPLDLSDAEKKTAQEIKLLIKKYKFKDSMKIKGDGARWHFGVLAQEVKSTFEENGLNPEEYGLFCYDYQEYIPATYDDNGNEITGEILAVDRYGIRYDELICFVIASL